MARRRLYGPGRLLANMAVLAVMIGVGVIALEFLATRAPQVNQPREGGRAASMPEAALPLSLSNSERGVADNRSGDGPVGQGIGIVQLLSMEANTPVPLETVWEFQSSLDEALIETFSLEEALLPELPEGEWHLRCLTPGWSAVTPSVDIRAGEIVIAWVAAWGTISVQVLDEEEIPVEGALVTWSCSSINSSADWALAHEVQTDRFGRGIIEAREGLAGTLFATAPGFLPTTRSVHGTLRHPVEMYLRRSGGEFNRVLLTDLSGTPVLGATLHVGGNSYGPSTESGTLHYPDSLDDLAKASIRADGFCVITCSFGELKRHPGMILQRAIPCRIFVHSGAVPASGALLVIESLTQPGNIVLTPPVEREKTCGKDGRVSFMLPEGATVELLALARDGLTGRRTIEPGPEQSSFEVPLDAAPLLEVFVKDEKGRAVGPVKARALYGKTEHELPQVGAGLPIRVPQPRSVAAILLEAPGFAALRLQPTRDRAVAREHIGGPGRVTVVLAGCRDVIVQLLDMAGTPVSGLQVRVWPQIDHAAILADPGLQGDLATSHPGWVVAPESARLAFADQEGRCRFPRMKPGIHWMVATVPPALDPSHTSLYRAVIRDFVIPGGPESKSLPWVLSPPRQLSLGLYDASSGRPVVRSTTVVVPKPSQFPRESHVGNIWSGLVRSDAHSATVRVAGYASESVKLSVAPGIPMSARVMLNPIGSTRIIFIGEAQRICGELLRFHFLNDDGPIVSSALSGTCVITESGEGVINLAHMDGSRLLLSKIVTDEFRATFEPSIVEWHPGMEYRVSVKIVELTNR